MEKKLKEIENSINCINDKNMNNYNIIVNDLNKCKEDFYHIQKKIDNDIDNIDFIEDIDNFDLNTQIDELDKLFNENKNPNNSIENYINNYVNAKTIIYKCREYLSCHKMSLEQLIENDNNLVIKKFYK